MSRAPVAMIGAVAIAAAGVLGLYAAADQASRPMAPLGGVFDRAEEVARNRADVARARFGQGSLEEASALDDVVEALVLNGRGAQSSTRSLAEQVLAAKQSRLGPSHVDLARSLVNLGDVLVAAGDYHLGAPFFEQAITLLEASDRSGDVRLAEALRHLGIVHNLSGASDAALRALESSLRLLETLPNEDRQLARTLVAMANARQNKGDYERSGVDIRRAVAIQGRVDPDHPEYADTLNRLAQQLWFEGRLPESRATSEEAVALAERTLRADHPTVARSLRYLAGTLVDLGDLVRSRALRERALGIIERELGPDHPETAVYMNSVAMAELELGEYPAARRRFERLLKTLEARLGPSHDFVATARLNLALVDARLGDYAGARQQQRLATAIWEKTLGRDHPYVALGLTEVSQVYREEGRPHDALPLLERALAIRQRSLGAEHRDVAHTLIDLAAARTQLGQLTQAERLAARAVRILEGLNEPDAPDFATALTVQAELQLRRSAVTDARRSYAQAVALRERMFGRAHPAVAEAQLGLAQAQAMSGDPASALDTAARAETTSRDHLRLMLASRPERQSLNYAATRPRGLDVILSMVGADARAAAIGLDEVIRNRASVLDEMAARRSGIHAAGDETRQLQAALASARQRFANLVVRGPGSLSVERYTALVNDARADSESTEEDLARRSAEFRKERAQANAGLDDVSALTPSDTALVSFVRYDRTVLPAVGPASSPQASARPRARKVPSYLAFILRRDTPPVTVLLGGASTIEGLVAEWRTGIQTVSAQSRASGVALRRLVWDPLADSIGDARMVLIVPDGALSLVPFSALPVGQRSYLLETGPVLHYLSAERDLVKSPSAPPAQLGLLAMGGPAFDVRAIDGGGSTDSAPPSSSNAPSLRGAPPSCGGLQSVMFQPLAGTVQEVRSLSGLWNQYAAADSEADAARVFVGRAATETIFKREAERHRVLHLATHGFFLNNACAPAPTGTRGVGGLARVGARPVENPLLLSGLALAGANRRAAGNADSEGRTLRCPIPP